MIRSDGTVACVEATGPPSPRARGASPRPGAIAERRGHHHAVRRPDESVAMVDVRRPSPTGGAARCSDGSPANQRMTGHRADVGAGRLEQRRGDRHGLVSPPGQLEHDTCSRVTSSRTSWGTCLNDIDAIVSSALSTSPTNDASAASTASTRNRSNGCAATGKRRMRSASRMSRRWSPRAWATTEASASVTPCASSSPRSRKARSSWSSSASSSSSSRRSACRRATPRSCCSGVPTASGGGLANHRARCRSAARRGSRVRGGRRRRGTSRRPASAPPPIPCAPSHRVPAASATHVDAPVRSPTPERSARSRPPRARERRIGLPCLDRAGARFRPAGRCRTPRRRPRPARRPTPCRARRERAIPIGRHGNRATTSSQRNCRNRTGGADRTNRTSDGQPANSLHAAVIPAEHLGERSDLRITERERVGAELLDLTSGPAPGQRDRHRLPARQHEVRVGRQARRQISHQLQARRHGGKLVQVIDDDADIDGRDLAQRVEDPVDVAAPPWRRLERRQDRRRQPAVVLVAGFARDPCVDAPWRGVVGPNRLRQCGRLAEPGAGHQTVTGTSNRAASASSARPRTSSACNGDGGTGADHRPTTDGPHSPTEPAAPGDPEDDSTPTRLSVGLRRRACFLAGRPSHVPRRWNATLVVCRGRRRGPPFSRREAGCGRRRRRRPPSPSHSPSSWCRSTSPGPRRRVWRFSMRLVDARPPTTNGLGGAPASGAHELRRDEGGVCAGPVRSPRRHRTTGRAVACAALMVIPRHSLAYLPTAAARSRGWLPEQPIRTAGRHLLLESRIRPAMAAVLGVNLLAGLDAALLVRLPAGLDLGGARAFGLLSFAQGAGAFGAFVALVGPESGAVGVRSFPSPPRRSPSVCWPRPASCPVRVHHLSAFGASILTAEVVITDRAGSYSAGRARRSCVRRARCVDGRGHDRRGRRRSHAHHLGWTATHPGHRRYRSPVADRSVRCVDAGVTTRPSSSHRRQGSVPHAVAAWWSDIGEARCCRSARFRAFPSRPDMTIGGPGDERHARQVSEPVARDALVGIDQPVRCSMAASSRTSTSTTRRAHRRCGRWSTRSTSSCRSTRASIAEPATSRDCSTSAFERATGDSSASSSAPTRTVTSSCSPRTRPRRSTSSPGALAVDDDAVVLTTMLEHHSNDLPWRGRVPHGARRRSCPMARSTSTTSIGASPSTPVASRSSPSPARRTSPASCSRCTSWPPRSTPPAGASSSTPPNSRRIADRHAAHDDPGHLDFVALSAHKMYAPYGTGVLVGPAMRVRPRCRDHAGGGTVQGGHDRRGRVGRPPRPGGGRQPERARCRGDGRRARGAHRGRARSHRRPRSER